MRYLDFRDAAILWLIANIGALTAAALIVIARHVEQPLATTVLATSVTASALTFMAGVASIVSVAIGAAKLKGDHDA